MHVNPAWRPTCQSVKRTLVNESSESRRVSRARNVLTKRRARFSFCVPVLVDDHDGDGLQWTYAGLTYLTHRAAVPYLAHVNTITCPAYLLPSSLVLLLDRISYSLSLVIFPFLLSVLFLLLLFFLSASHLPCLLASGIRADRSASDDLNSRKTLCDYKSSVVRLT